jgi:hypothetical protein
MLFIAFDGVQAQFCAVQPWFCATCRMAVVRALANDYSASMRNPRTGKQNRRTP